MHENADWFPKLFHRQTQGEFAIWISKYTKHIAKLLHEISVFKKSSSSRTEWNKSYMQNVLCFSFISRSLLFLAFYISPRLLKNTVLKVACLYWQVAQLWQRDRATHELLRFAKLWSRIFEPPFWGLRGNVDASCVRRWEKRGRLPIGDNLTF